jgi:predicted RNase H-like HicB family nuclease
MANKYSFNIEWSEEDQEYLATCPSFPGLTAFGDTEEEALSEGKIALQGFIETCDANAIPLPEPAIKGKFSGKFQLRLPKTLHRLAVLMARTDDVSLNVYITDAVRARVSGEQIGAQVLKEVRQHLLQTRSLAASALTVAQPVALRTERHEKSEITFGFPTVATSGGKAEKGN